MEHVSHLFKLVCVSKRERATQSRFWLVEICACFCFLVNVWVRVFFWKVYVFLPDWVSKGKASFHHLHNARLGPAICATKDRILHA